MNCFHRCTLMSIVGCSNIRYAMRTVNDVNNWHVTANLLHQYDRSECRVRRVAEAGESGSLCREIRAKLRVGVSDPSR